MKTLDINAANRKMDGAVTFGERYHVFLGGSCGGRTSPTTWRKEVAIPFLEENKVTFYNPQVETWTQDLMIKEHRAKENSDWLLFMLESSTRGIVSLVEVAYTVGSGRSVICVLQEERLSGKLSITDDTVTALESEDIVQTQNLVESISGRHDSCQYFSVLEKGLMHITAGLKTTRHGKSLVQNGNSYSGAVTERKVFHDWIQKISNLLTPSKQNKPQTEVEGRKKRPSNLRILPFQRYAVGIITPEHTSLNLVQTILDRANSSRLEVSREAIYVAQGTSSKDLDSLLQCSTVFVVIPSTHLASTHMCKAAYMLAKNKNIVLCVQNLSNDCLDNGNTQLTKSAVDDYNRARSYLRDMASRHLHASMHTCLEDSLLSLLSKLNSTQRRHSLPTTITED